MPAPDTMPAHVLRMVALIESRADAPLSLRTLADALGRQEAYLGRLFRQRMGVSVREYVATLRLDRAATLIRRGEKIEAVALSVGYRRKKSFYRQFVRRFGVTPAAYRRETAAVAAPRPSPASLLHGLRFRMLGPAIAGGISAITGAGGRRPTLYVAACTGGLWRTRNRGTTWDSPFTDRDGGPVTTIAAAPSDPSFLWLGTGEAGARPMPGDGLHRSIDGGATWMRAGLDGLPFISHVAIDPRDPETVFALAAGWSDADDASGASGAGRAVYKTCDGGRTWTNILTPPAGGAVTDLVLDPSTPDILIAAVGGCPQASHAGIYKTESGGRNWTRLAAGLPGGSLTHAVVALCARHPRVMYAALTSTSHRSIVFRSDDGGHTWERRQAVPGAVCGVRLAVDPCDPERLYVAGEQLQVSDDGGRSFTRLAAASKDVAACGIWMDPDDPYYVVCGSHEGVSLSHDRGRTWHLCRNLPLARVSRVSADSQRPYLVYAGLDSGGSWVGSAATRDARGIAHHDWVAIPDGGVFAVPDPVDGRSVYTQTHDGAIIRHDPATGDHRTILPAAGGEAAGEGPSHVHVPLLVSRYAPSTIYAGVHRVMRSTDRGVSWMAISSDFCTPPMADMGGSDEHDVHATPRARRSRGAVLTALAESGKTSDLLYAGTSDGRVFVCRRYGASWVDVSSALPDVPSHARVHGISTSWTDADTVYATFNSPLRVPHQPCLLISTDAGRRWRSIAGNLPPSPIYVVYEDPHAPNLLYAGTSLGLFVSFNRGDSWIRVEGNLPGVPVTDVVVHPRDNDLVVATYGRGVWILDDASPLQELCGDVLDGDPYLFPVRAGTQMMRAEATLWRGDDTFFAANPPRGTFLTYYLRDSASGVRLIIHDAHGRTVRTLDGPRTAGLHRVCWDLRERPPRRVSARVRGGSGPSEILEGAFAQSGRFQVTLMVNGRTCGARTFSVDLDPLVDLPEPARELQRRALVTLTDMQDRLIACASALRAMARELAPLYAQLRLQPSLPVSVLNTIAALVHSVATLRRTVGDSPTAPAPLDARRPALRPRVDALKAQIAGSPSPPTQTQSEALARLRQELAAALAMMANLVAGELPTTNRLLDSHGLSAVRLSIKSSHAFTLADDVT